MGDARRRSGGSFLRGRRIGPRCFGAEALEGRTLLSADVLGWHNDVASTGQNLAETVLTRANVNPATFGKLFSLPVQGQVYAQPLVKRGVTITTGPAAGVHDAVFVATQHDQLYAFDAAADSPTLLWQRNFLDLTVAANHLPSATALTTVPQADVLTSDITVEIGITGTPVIDPATSTLYLITKTKETVAGTAHYVQRLHAVSVSDGTDRVAPFLIGDTTGANTNNTQIYVYGNTNSAGNVVDPYNGTGRRVVQFNALRENQRPALTLVNGVVYTGWASHGDNGPYHGWMVGWDKNTLALKGVLCTTPTGGLGGIWMGAGGITFDGSYFYAVTGNGTFTPYNGASTATNPTPPAPGPLTGLNAQGFPADANYGDSFLKIGLDATTTPVNQNANGWGLKVVDYFTPFNEQYLDQRDIDLGSSPALILPDSAGSLAHPHLLMGGGKEGMLYLIDRDNMGKFGLRDSVVQNIPSQISGLVSSPAFYNGRLYVVPSYGGVAKAFRVAGAVVSTAPDSASADSFAFAGSTPSVSANGMLDGIVWDVDRGTNQLRAYSSDSYATELYTSDRAAGGRDALGNAVKFEVPTVANGRVYVASGTGDPNNALVVYGLTAVPDAPPSAPNNLLGQALAPTQLYLSWTDTSAGRNRADSFYLEQSPDGESRWTQVAVVTAPNDTITGLAPGTSYYFRVRAHDAAGFSGYGYTAAATSSGGGTSIDYSGGFADASALALNGGATVSGGRLHLTTAATNQARSAFFTTPQNITSFGTTFTYTKNGAADGATFVIQRDPRGLAALGGAGGALGYGVVPGAPAISPSLALAINIYTGHPLGTELLSNGNVDFAYSQSNINTSLNDTPITVTISYSGGTLVARLVQGSASETKTLAVDLPALLGGNTAFVGFTGGTGSLTAVQDIANWTFSPPAPPGAPSRPDLADASDTGASNSDDVTRDNTPTFTGIAAPGSTVTIRVDGQPAGSATTPPDGLFSVTTAPLDDGTHTVTAIAFTGATGDASAASLARAVTIDTVAPSVVATSDPTGGRELRLTFNEPVVPLSLADLTLVNRLTAAAAPPGSIVVNTTPNTAVFTFPGYGAGALPAGDYRATLRAAALSDAAGNAPASDVVVDFTAVASIVSRLTFYNNSAADGRDPTGNADDDAAIAPDKRALLPGQAASVANVTAYTRGLNGLMVDVAGLPDGATLSHDDVRLDTSADGATWTPLGGPVTVSTRPRAGASGSDRLTLILPDGAVSNLWLRVTLVANGHTGLPASDVFYFGNLVGDTGNDRATPTVNVTDYTLTRAALLRTDAASLNRFDFDREGTIDATDLLIVRNNQRHSLPLFSAPAAAASPARVAGDVTLPAPTRNPARPVRRTVFDFSAPDPLA